MSRDWKQRQEFQKAQLELEDFNRWLHLGAGRKVQRKGLTVAKAKEYLQDTDVRELLLMSGKLRKVEKAIRVLS